MASTQRSKWAKAGAVAALAGLALVASLKGNSSEEISVARQPRESQIWATRWQIWANIATIFAAIVAISALIAGLCTFQATAKSQDETAALSSLQAYIQLAMENVNHSYRPATEPLGRDADWPEWSNEDKQYAWFASHAVFTAESIYSLTSGEDAWEQTVLGILDNHVPFILYDGFPCREYNREFLRFIRSNISGSICPQTVN